MDSRPGQSRAEFIIKRNRRRSFQEGEREASRKTVLCRSSSLVEKDASKEKSTRTEIRLRSKEREPLRPLSRAEDSRRHSRENTNMQRDISVHTGRASSYSSSVGSDNHRRVSHESDYDRLRDQCMNAMSELETLKRQHAEIIGRCDFAVQEADYFRKQHKAVVIKCDQLVREAQALRSQFEHLQQEKQKLQQDYEEIVLLRELEKVEKLETSGSSGKNASGGGASKAEDHSDDVELLKKQNMDLTEELEDFKADYALVTSKLSKSEEETAKLREQYNALVSERDTLIIERNALKQQCTAAIRGYDKALREKDETAKSAVHAKQQRDLALRECDQVMALRIKDSKDITKLKDERNAAINEYKLIMSERDSVHKEIEKLQEDIDVVKTENKSLKDDKERIQHEAECLRQEIRSVLADRDQVVKESHDLRERLHGALKDRETTMKKMEEMRQDLEMLKQERNAARKERSEAIVHRDKILRECFEVKQMFQSVESGETEQGEEFKKQFEGLSKELTKAWKEAEVAMMRRDWAFSERDKIVRELERIRAINTDLVEERDCLMDELRRSRSEGEVLKRQNSTFLKEIHLTSKHREGGLTPEERAQLIASADSAIDTESCEYDLETVEFERGVFGAIESDVIAWFSILKTRVQEMLPTDFEFEFQESKEEDFGFRIAGGIDSPLYPDDCSIFVTHVIQGSPADGKLRVNDCLLRVNDVDLTSVELQMADEATQRNNFLSFTILRKHHPNARTPLQRVKLRSTEEKELGLSIDSGLHIKRIEPGSAASEEETLSVGDKILSINGNPIENMAYNEAKTLLKRSEISLTVLKPNTSTDSSHRSLTNQLAGQDKAESDSQLGHTDMKHQSPELRQRPRHSRSPSAPVPLMVGGHDFKGIVRHMRCNSAVSGSSFSSYDKRSPGNVRRLSLTEEERAKILKNLLVEEERIRMDNEKLLNDDEISVDQLEEEEKESPSPLQKYLSSSPPPPPHRSNSYMSAVMSHRMANDSPQTVQSGSHTDSIYNSEHNYIHSRSMKRPYSAPGSRHSVTSGSSTGRPDIPRGISPGPLSVNRSDPLALSPKTVGQSSAFSLVTNTSASTATRLTGSLGRANRKYRTPIHTAAGKFYPHQNSSSVQVMAPSSVLPYKVVSTEVYPGAPAQIPKYMQNASHTSNPNEQYYKYRTFPGKTNRINFDPSDRASSYSGMAKTGIKHHKSTSSRASSTSSVSSGYTTPKQDQNFIQPVYEEENVARNEEDANYAEEEYHQQPTGESEPRVVIIEKNSYPLGISIAEGARGGVFVTAVTEDSMAARAGLQYGDQLLEFNGINLRCANYEQAVLILKQDTNSVTILAQYNPSKLYETVDTESRASLRPPSRSNSESNTPTEEHRRLQKLNSNTSTVSSHSRKNNVVVKSSSQITAYTQNVSPIPEGDSAEEIRHITLHKPSPNSLVGIGIVGGNAVGIFISEIQPESVAAMHGGLNCGDQILEYNGVSLRNTTAEQATLELGKPVETIQMLVQYNPSGFRKAQEQACDSFYMRALFDRSAHSKEELSFRKGDILYVTDTLNQGQLGVWKAWLVCENDESQKKEYGTIPSRTKAEQEVLLRRCSVYSEDKLKNRHSLFRRSKKGSHSYSISHSRESSDSRGEEAGSSIGSNSVALGSDMEFAAYHNVRRYESHFLRPVVVLGPMAEPICDKLVMEKPYKFARCLPEMIKASREAIEKDVDAGKYVEFTLSRRGTSYACITPNAIKEVMQKTKHCLLDITSTAAERIIPLQFHPIVIFLKYKSYKQIKELRDGHYIREKITSKESKDHFDNSVRMERECKHLITVSVSGSTLDSLCSQIFDRVQEEQKKPVWVDDC